MERVVFLDDQTGAQVSCLLNPETITLRRTAGLLELPFDGAPVGSTGLSDTPMVATGGGRTEIELDLLFDVGLVVSEAPPTDVRTLTLPLWRLCENSIEVKARRQVPHVWLLWGRAWSLLCVIEAIAERFDDIAPSGAPGRSWIRLRARRVNDSVRPAESTAPATTPSSQGMPGLDRPTAITVTGDGTETDDVGGRVDLIATELLGDPAAWPRLCEINGIEDPLRIAAGTVLSTGGAP